MSNAQAFII